VLDSLAPSIPLKAYAYNEIRYRMLADSKPEEAERLLALAQEDVHHRWQVYEDLARRWAVSESNAPPPKRAAM
jgi:pyruvate-ferredoxin/flavodoxin oxidoreductase